MSHTNESASLVDLLMDGDDCDDELSVPMAAPEVAVPVEPQRKSGPPAAAPVVPPTNRTATGATSTTASSTHGIAKPQEAEKYRILAALYKASAAILAIGEMGNATDDAMVEMIVAELRKRIVYYNSL